MDPTSNVSPSPAASCQNGSSTTGCMSLRADTLLQKKNLFFVFLSGVSSQLACELINCWNRCLPWAKHLYKLSYRWYQPIWDSCNFPYTLPSPHIPPRSLPKQFCLITYVETRLRITSQTTGIWMPSRWYFKRVLLAVYLVFCWQGSQFHVLAIILA